MIASMFPRFAVAALFGMAVLLPAQQPTEAQLTKLYSQMDDALGLRPGMTIADIGTGFAIDHALGMAEKLAPEGKLFCVDVKQSVLTKIQDQANTRHLSNLKVVLGAEDDPRLPPGIFDAILISNTYHEFTQPVAMLKQLCAALKPGGKLVIVENCSIAHRGDSREVQTRLHDLAPELLEGELAAEGLEIKKRIEPILVESADRFRYLFTVEKT
jgi:ubiquinone/menaquinone biosynthesis C-methylase UbiE